METDECQEMLINHQHASVLGNKMDHYGKKHPTGKKMHDPLTAACAIDESICRYKDVKTYYEKQAGKAYREAKLASGTCIKVSAQKLLK